MLWYKAWLETRTRFLIALAGITGLCSYRVYDLDKSAAPWTKANYYYFVLHSGQELLSVMWIVAVTLLLMGGLLREKAAGVSSFTLALPVSRMRLMSVRICLGLIQALTLIAVPWMAMFAIAVHTGLARSITQVCFYGILLAGGGAVLAGAAALVSSLVESEYLAPMLSFGFALACANAPKSLDFLNPLEFIGGRDYLGSSNMLIGPVPWARLAANGCIAALLIAVSVIAVQKRDF